jgi:hypothetical protein
MKQSIKKRGQVWTVDFLVGFLIFIVVLLAAIKIIMSIIPSTNYDVLYKDTAHLSSTLTGKGFPNDWNETTVIIPGLGENNRLNFTKIQAFDDIAYQRTKTLMHITNDYIFFFKNSSQIINISGKCVRGYNIDYNSNCEPDINSIEYDNLIKFERIVIFENSTNNSVLISMVIYSWN